MAKSDEPPPEAGCFGCGGFTVIVVWCIFAFGGGCTPTDNPNLNSRPVASVPRTKIPAIEAPITKLPDTEALFTKTPDTPASSSSMTAEVANEDDELGPYPAMIVVQADEKFERLRAAGDLHGLRDEVATAKRMFTQIKALHSRLDQATRLPKNPTDDSGRQWSAFARQFKADADAIRAKVDREIDDHLLKITFIWMCDADLYLRQTVKSDPELTKYHNGCLSDVDVYLTTLDAKLRKATPPDESPAQSEAFTFRLWKDHSGKFSTKAAFVNYGSGRLKLLKEAGEIIQVDVEQISDEDKEYLRKIWRERGLKPSF